jgi:hypothetical protein
LHSIAVAIRALGYEAEIHQAVLAIVAQAARVIVGYIAGRDPGSDEGGIVLSAGLDPCASAIPRKTSLPEHVPLGSISKDSVSKHNIDGTAVGLSR